MTWGQLGDGIGHRCRILFRSTAALAVRRAENVACHRHIRCGGCGISGGHSRCRCRGVLGHADGGGCRCHRGLLGGLCGHDRVGGGVRKAAADRNDSGRIIHQRILQRLVDCIAGIVHGIVELPLEVAALDTTCLGCDDRRHILCVVSLVAVHDAGIGIEVVIACAAGNGLDAVRNFFRRAGDFIGIERGAVLGIRDIAGCTLDVVAARLDDAAGLAGECTLAQYVCTLSGTHHGVLAVAEVVVLRKGRCTHGHADAVLGVAVEVVVIAVDGAGADSRVAGVGVVVPVVMIGHIVGLLLGLHALEVALAVVPEMVIGMCDIGGGLGVQSAVALYLVCI